MFLALGLGLALLLNMIAMLIVFVALVHLVNGMLAFLPNINDQAVTLQRILGTVMAPVCWLIGIPWEQAINAGALMGLKTVLNELIAYLELSRLPADALDPRSRLIMIYALCGFANFGSVGIMIGGLTVMAPERRSDVLALGIEAVDDRQPLFFVLPVGPDVVVHSGREGPCNECHELRAVRQTTDILEPVLVERDAQFFRIYHHGHLSCRTPPFTGPRRTTILCNAARPTAPCATACSPVLPWRSLLETSPRVVPVGCSQPTGVTRSQEVGKSENAYTYRRAEG